MQHCLLGLLTWLGCASEPATTKDDLQVYEEPAEMQEVGSTQPCSLEGIPHDYELPEISPEWQKKLNRYSQKSGVQYVFLLRYGSNKIKGWRLTAVKDKSIPDEEAEKLFLDRLSRLSKLVNHVNERKKQ